MRRIAPTPWRKASGKPYVIVAANNRRICKLNFTSNPSEDFEGAAAESIATADLLLAAPKMFQALKMVDLGLHTSDERGPCICSQCEFRRLAAEIIAEVEGGKA